MKFLIISLIFYNNICFANYFGRFTSGTYVSKEHFSSDQPNDQVIVNQRFYLNINHLNKNIDKDHEFIVDLRDEYNFFKKLNKQNQTLDPENEIEARQLVYKKGFRTKDNFFWAIGRFSVKDAGGTVIDGSQGGYKFSDNLKFSLFLGFNPITYETLKLKWNPNQKIYGITSFWQQKGTRWRDYNFLSTSIITQLQSNQLDRRYLYNNFLFHTSKYDYIQSISYLDFLPNIYVQNLWVAYTFYPNYTRRNKFSFTLLSVDTVQYLKLSEILNTLPESRYNELKFKYSKQIPQTRETMIFQSRYGQRIYDKKKRIELMAGLNIPRFITDYDTASFNLLYRKNFDYNEVIGRFEFMRFGHNVEISIGQDLILRKYDNGKKVIPFITEINSTYFYTKKLFFTGSFQYAQDDKVKITSILLKLNYRFGKKAVAPLRDGSAPLGRL